VPKPANGEAYFARPACLPGGLYVLLALIFVFFLLAIFNDFLETNDLRSTGPIFTILFTKGRYLFLDDRYEPLSQFIKGR